MRVTLSHEHVLASFQPYAERQVHPLTYEQGEVVRVVRPYLDQVKKLGCRTFVDCTAVGLGRDARLLKRLSEETGLHFLTVTVTMPPSTRASCHPLCSPIQTMPLRSAGLMKRGTALMQREFVRA